MLRRHIPHKPPQLIKRLITMLSIWIIDPEILAAFEENSAWVVGGGEDVVGYVFWDAAGC
jgi:hypothetical protein